MLDSRTMASPPPEAPLPDHYRETLRTLIRYSCVMAVVGVLAGILFQESGKKLSYADAAAGLHLESVYHLALVHGHVLFTAVVLPLLLGGAMVLARRIGGRELRPAAMRWLVWGYLPFAAFTVSLMLYKGYHFLLSVRHGATDLATVDAAFFGGITALRHVVYGVAHTGMGLSLLLFMFYLWRSLSRTEKNGTGADAP